MDQDFNDLEDVKPIFEDIDDDDRKEELIAKRIRMYELLEEGKIDAANDFFENIMLSTANDNNEEENI